jgi:hypothetical protein
MSHCLRVPAGLLGLAALALAAAGCVPDEEKYLKPVAAGTGAWEKRVQMPVLDAHFNLRSEDKRFRDDGVFEGNLAIHTQQLEGEFAPAAVAVTGKPEEGLVAEVQTPEGQRGVVIYARTTGDRTLDRGRRELLRAAAVIRLGMREGLEEYFRNADLRLQFKTISDRQLAKVAEAYALTKLGCTPERVEDMETTEALHMITDRGYTPSRGKPGGGE